MAGWHVGFQFHLILRVKQLETASRELLQVNFTVVLRAGNQRHEQVEVLLPFTRAQVDSEPSWIDRRVKQS